MKKALSLITATLTCATLLAATPEGDKYLQQPLPRDWGYTEHVPQTLPTDDNWWNKFEDETLDSLITLGVKNNMDLSQAMRRRELARLAVKQAQAAYYPQVSVNAGWSRSREPGAISGSNVPASYSSAFGLGADMSWELDVFGRITSQVKAKKGAYNASRADYVAAMISVSADIATNYMDLRVLQTRLQVAQEHLASQKKVLSIVETRHEAGLVSKLDVAQAKSVYYSTESSVPALQAQVKSTINALALLVGVYPEELQQILTANKEMPPHNHIVPVGVPADLLRRRPDIVAAEYQLAVDAAAIGIAKKDFLPTLALTGSIGVKSHDLHDIFHRNATTWSVAPTLSWTIFNGMARKVALEESKVQMKADVDAYNLTVMTAVQEVDNALSAYYAAVETLKFERLVFEQSHEAFTLSIDQYKEGLSAFTNVVDAQIDWLNSANALVTARGNALTALIALYKALGGSPEMIQQ